eukprot:39644_1
MRADIQPPPSDGFLKSNHTSSHYLRTKPPPPPRTQSTPKLPPPKPMTLIISAPTQTNLHVLHGCLSHKTNNLSHSSFTSHSMRSLPSLPSPPSRPSYSHSHASKSTYSQTTSPRNQLQINLPSPKQPKQPQQQQQKVTLSPKEGRFGFPSSNTTNNYIPSSIQRVNTTQTLMRNNNNNETKTNNENVNMINNMLASYSYNHLPQICESPRHRLSSGSSRRSSRSNSYASSRSSNSPRNGGHITRKRSAYNKKENGRNIECVCGRKMDLTQNPRNKYPPNAVLYCQQNDKCRKKLIVQKDWFYVCKKRTKYHDSKDGKHKICYSCSISLSAKQERIRKNHHLLIKQIKQYDIGQVYINK